MQVSKSSNMSLSIIRNKFEASVRRTAKRVVARMARRLVPERVDLPLSTWRLSRAPSGALTLGSVDLHELLERRGSPLHVVDADKLVLNAARFMARPPGAQRGCEVFCSYKTNPVPGILRFLHARGLGAEVVSAYELWLALRLGVEPRAIVYNGPAKSDESIVSALKSGVGLINVNSRAEIAHLAGLARKLQKKPDVGIRVVVPGGVGGQLGERIDTGAALRAFAEAHRCPDLNVVALHSHFNGRIVSASQLEGFLSALLSFADDLYERLGLILQIVDVGGNLTCPTVSPLTPRARKLAVTLGCEPSASPPEAALSIDDYVARVVRRVESHFAERRWPAPRIFVEPGRALTSNTQMLLCKVANVRDPDTAGLRWAVLDIGIHAAEPLASEWHQLFPVKPRRGAAPELHRLTGPSCMLSDQLYPAWKMPELAVGDGLAIMDTGAYFVAFSAPFSFPRPAIVMLDGAREVMVRSAETFEDLVALDGEWQPRRRSGADASTTVDAAAALASEAG
jgi:diaminopimelate decarboxylase